ncbi:hypothetical protein [Sinorhizobium medicae]|uniref:hypothetical protein n=1 Tax=Sinorhizobium medicae TaxID=110321 RepID=UPI001AAE303D|nr:hypothetical protein [Sinorhizobium medicae]MBO1965606.1 hypothetical protein [Sinorhizobium medicae]WQO54904.1 hypothetical protein U8C36_21355 [Sinorhizobium medicae]WQP41300.1 hypothetical protein U8C38_28355 [Sinorhizobium medicae]
MLVALTIEGSGHREEPFSSQQRGAKQSLAAEALYAQAGESIELFLHDTEKAHAVNWVDPKLAE